MMSTHQRDDRGIVVLGGGFAGFWAAVAARRVSGADTAITLVSPQPDLVMRPRLYEAAPASLSMPLADPLALVGVTLVLDRALTIRHDLRTVELQQSPPLRYEALVVATGSTMRRPDVPGAAHAYSIDDQPHAVAFDARLAQLARQPTPRIAVIGAGFTGIELALELPERLRIHGRQDDEPAIEVVLIDRNPVVGAELGAGPRPVIEEALAHAGVSQRLGTTITQLSHDTVSYDDGNTEHFDAVVLCTGLAATTLPTPLPGPLDELGRHRLNRSLEHPALRGVFLAGDIAAVDTGTGHLTLQSCQHALRTGRVAGENAARHHRAEPLIDYHQPDYVTCLDLGSYGAVLTQGWEREVVASGQEAKTRKQFINRRVIYPDLSQGAAGLLAQSEPLPPPQPTAR